MPNYIERRRTCEAREVTEDNAAEIAAWLGGPDFAMAMPDGSVLFKLGGVWLTAPIGHVIFLEDGQLATTEGEEFNRGWEPVEDEGDA